MNKNHLPALKKRLEAAGLTVDEIQIRNAAGTGYDRPALRIDTDYYGPYPPKETYAQEAAAREILRRCRSRFTMKTQIMHVSSCIYERKQIMNANLKTVLGLLGNDAAAIRRAWRGRRSRWTVIPCFW